MCWKIKMIQSLDNVESIKHRGTQDRYTEKTKRKLCIQPMRRIERQKNTERKKRMKGDHEDEIH